ncbi:MAG: 30S ribosomal protein S13 [bacterium]|nr:30S ribosomal protein S13 [bacterium]
MPRIAGVSIPDNKKIAFALRYIYGIGPVLSQKIVDQAKIDPQKRAGQLGTEEINRLQRVIDGFMIEGSLRQWYQENIKRLKQIKCYRGLRHEAGLPARGQRTRSNARTKRGKRKTVGAMRKDMLQKLEAASRAKK